MITVSVEDVRYIVIWNNSANWEYLYFSIYTYVS